MELFLWIVAILVVFFWIMKALGHNNIRKSLWNGYRAGNAALNDVDDEDYLLEWVKKHRIQSAALQATSEATKSCETLGLALAGLFRLDDLQMGYTAPVSSVPLMKRYKCIKEEQNQMVDELLHSYKQTKNVDLIRQLAEMGEYDHPLAEQVSQLYEGGRQQAEAQSE